MSQVTQHTELTSHLMITKYQIAVTATKFSHETEETRGCRLHAYTARDSRFLGFLGSYAMQSDGWIPTFRRTVLPPSSG
jgi:hypothetical protein